MLLPLPVAWWWWSLALGNERHGGRYAEHLQAVPHGGVECSTTATATKHRFEVAWLPIGAGAQRYNECSPLSRWRLCSALTQLLAKNPNVVETDHPRLNNQHIVTALSWLLAARLRASIQLQSRANALPRPRTTPSHTTSIAPPSSWPACQPNCKATCQKPSSSWFDSIRSSKTQ